MIWKRFVFSLRVTRLRLRRYFLKEHSMLPDRLADFPESGRIVPEMNDPNFREIIPGNYRLIYRLRSGDVQIITVHHGARELKLLPWFTFGVTLLALNSVYVAILRSE